MKLILKIVYQNLDKEWLEWYLAELEKRGYPEMIRTASALRSRKVYSFIAKDPMNPKVSAETTYELIDEDSI